MKRYKTAEEAIPSVWKTSPLPKSKPKRPVGRPKKRRLSGESTVADSVKRARSEQSDSDGHVSVVTPITGDKELTSVEPLSVPMDLNTESVSGDSVDLNMQSVSVSVNAMDLNSDSVPSDSVDTNIPSNSVSENAPETDVPPVARGKYKHFTYREKLSVKDFAKQHGIRAAAKHFKIPKSTVNNWCKTDFNDDNLRNHKTGHIQKSGRPLSYDEDIDMMILAYVLELRDMQAPVTIEDICNYAREVVKPVSPGFQASNGWVAGFMKRHDLCLRAKTSLAQRLPKDLEEKIQSFHAFVVDKRAEDEFDDHLIVNMDETPVYFDLVPGKTVNEKGAKSVLVRTTGNEKRHFTVVLAVSANGDVLPPMVIFKGKRDLKFEFPKDWVVTVQEKGWMDGELMLRWINEIYLKYTKKDRSMLVLDSFRGHLTDKVKKAFRKGNTVMAVIPGGCTSKLQPLDVSINKPFKTELRNSWRGYIREASKTARETGDRVKSATKETVVSWLASAVDSLVEKPDMVRKSFKVCGISNNLNGSEDGEIRSDPPVPANDFLDSDDEDFEFEGFEASDLPEYVGQLDSE